MDGKLAEMLARRKREQEEAEEEEWKARVGAARDDAPARSYDEAPDNSTQQRSGQTDTRAEQTPSPEPGPGRDESPFALLEKMEQHLSSEESEAGAADETSAEEDQNRFGEEHGGEDSKLQEETSGLASGDIRRAVSTPEKRPPAIQAGESFKTTESSEENGPIKTILKPAGSFKGLDSPPGAAEGLSSPTNKSGLRWREERLTSEIDITNIQARKPKFSAEEQSTVAYRMSGVHDNVPVLVIPTGDNWRAGAQASSTAFNTLQNQLGINLRENPNEVPSTQAVNRAAPGFGALDGPTQQSFKGKPPAETMAKAKSRVLSSYGNSRSIGSDPLFPRKDSAGGEHKEETRVSVPASSRAGILDNNAPIPSQVLALSTGTIEERAEAARRICRRAKNAREVSELVDAGVIGSIGPLLSDPRGVDAAIEALLRLCSAIKEGAESTHPETQRRMELELCSSLEENGVAERLAALICWSRDEPLKGRMALLIFHMAQNHNLADRVIVQDGAIAALVHLLDSPMESASASAAAALANISYWSTEPAPRLSHFKILCAL